MLLMQLKSADVAYGNATLRTSPSSGQAAVSSRLRHPSLPACHSRAALDRPNGRCPSVSLGIQWGMIEVRETSAYAVWFTSLRDRTAKARIDIRLRRLSLGNSGDIRSVGEGVSELRIHYGPGYRIYLTSQGDTVVILLAGGDKSSQDQDIRLAKELARNL